MKPDKSPKIHQRSKIKKDSLKLKSLVWTEKQQELIRLIKDSSTKVVFIKGPAGSAKTSVSIYTALDLLNQQKVSDIVLIRSAVESSDAKMGFLPGDLADKFGVYLTPFNEKLMMFLSEGEIKNLEADGRIQPCPINFARGVEWTVKCVVADEAQNMTLKELITMMTRVGEHSKLLICADPEQSDLPTSKSGGFMKLWELFNDEESREQGIHCFEFSEEDILRSGLVGFLIQKFKKLSSPKAD